MNKIIFIRTLQETRAQWQTVLAQMDEQRLLEPGIVDTWSVKDLVAHMSWYEREMIPVISQRVFAGSPWWAFSADERNELIYRQNSQRPLREILQEGEQSYSDLLAAAQSLDDEDLNDSHRFKDMPDDWVPWHVFAENSFKHYQDHLSALRRWVTTT